MAKLPLQFRGLVRFPDPEKIYVHLSGTKKPSFVHDFGIDNGEWLEPRYYKLMDILSEARSEGLSAGRDRKSAGFQTYEQLARAYVGVEAGTIKRYLDDIKELLVNIGVTPEEKVFVTVEERQTVWTRIREEVVFVPWLGANKKAKPRKARTRRKKSA
jgi:hypothetical protein